MHNRETQSDKVSEIKTKSLRKIATVSSCLVDHERCTKSYVDFTGTYEVFCNCSCHKERFIPLGGTH
jgi:hypothetical protein